jgi:hypothetical protein
VAGAGEAHVTKAGLTPAAGPYVAGVYVVSPWNSQKYCVPEFGGGKSLARMVSVVEVLTETAEGVRVVTREQAVLENDEEAHWVGPAHEFVP